MKRARKTRRRPDPYALNPEKILAREKKKNSAPLCEVCQQREATTHVSNCGPGDQTKQSSFCERCFASTMKFPAEGSCQYCGAPGDFAGGYMLPSGEMRNMFRCETCRNEWEAYLKKPEQREPYEEYFKLSRKMADLPDYKKAKSDEKLMAEWIAQPERGAKRKQS
jgi:hypothetical protein